MKLQRKARLGTIVFVAAALSLGLPLTGAEAQTPPQSLDGQWLSNGDGHFFEFQGESARDYEITTLSCIAVGTVTRKTAPGPANETVYAGDEDMFRILPATSADTRWLCLL